jgi:hypothetical protein
MVGAVLAGLTLAATAVPAGARSQHVRVTIKRWQVETLGGRTSAAVAPGKTITHCASDPVETIHARGQVTGAVQGRRITVKLLVGEALRDTFHYEWTHTGNRAYHEEISNEEGLPDGRWALKVIEAGKTIGQSSVLVAANPSC